MTLQNKALLQEAMDKIKAILVEHDIAASIVLAGPTSTAHIDGLFAFLSYNHIDASFSIAKRIAIPHAENSKGPKGGIIIQTKETKTVEEAHQQIRLTTAMFAALGTGTSSLERECMSNLKSLQSAIDQFAKAIPATINPTQLMAKAYIINQKSDNRGVLITLMEPDAVDYCKHHPGHTFTLTDIIVPDGYYMDLVKKNKPLQR